jgi:hypothetical protein
LEVASNFCGRGGGRYRIAKTFRDARHSLYWPPPRQYIKRASVPAQSAGLDCRARLRARQKQAETSHVGSEHGGDLFLTHPIEVVGNRDLTLEEADAASVRRGVQSLYLHQRLPVPRDDERFSVHSLVDQLRKLLLRVFDLYCVRPLNERK